MADSFVYALFFLSFLLLTAKKNRRKRKENEKVEKQQKKKKMAEEIVTRHALPYIHPVPQCIYIYFSLVVCSLLLGLLCVYTCQCVCVCVYIENERHQMATLIIKHLARFLFKQVLTHFLSHR